MKISEAEQLILRQWDIWAFTNLPAGKEANGADALIFFGDLGTNHQNLIGFEAAGDKWQIVHGWLMRHGKVND